VYKGLMIKYEYGKKMSERVSLKAGGPAYCLAEVGSVDDVLDAVTMADENKKPLAIVGNGTNLLVHDEGFDGVVLYPVKGFDYIKREAGDVLKIGAAVSLGALISKCAEWGLGGSEFLSGVPGSFGGAVFMNAGVRALEDEKTFIEIKDIIIGLDVLDLKEKKKEVLKREDIRFGYRSSGLDNKFILGGSIKLKKENKENINNRLAGFIKKREWFREIRYPSAGSVFKNPDAFNPAGKLIEDCGLKGKRIGGAEISGAHANFIVNTGGAKAKDILDLIDLAKNSVKKKFGIELELELKVI
jgi:UDP-N-acetylmuramate dehydrogenase